MAYGHAERNLALIRLLEAETRQVLTGVSQPDPEQSAWLQEITSPGKQAVSQVSALTAQNPAVEAAPDTSRSPDATGCLRSKAWRRPAQRGQ